MFLIEAVVLFLRMYIYYLLPLQQFKVAIYVNVQKWKQGKRGSSFIQMRALTTPSGRRTIARNGSARVHGRLAAIFNNPWTPYCWLSFSFCHKWEATARLNGLSGVPSADGSCCIILRSRRVAQSYRSASESAFYVYMYTCASRFPVYSALVDRE